MTETRDTGAVTEMARAPPALATRAPPTPDAAR